MKKLVFLLIGFIVLHATSQAQLDKLPDPVKETFTKQYPNADSIAYVDNLLSSTVHFLDHGDRYTANYTKKGVWKDSEKDWSYDRLPDSVRDGLSKSKYANWKVEETKVLYQPGGLERYRIKVSKSDLQKKLLYFNAEGRLLEDSMTL